MILLSILDSTLAITAAVTGIGLVALAMWIAKLISPRSFNVQKGEPYECGIPTRGESMSQFHVGYYLFAILFLMFDVECVFLFPWGVNVSHFATLMGGKSLLSVAFFFSILVLGLVYAWRKGALEWK
ncbi:MAG: NADH-quinone oxidoreductase subunit A [Muribaculaceae bacterium]|nr:NADH-quinone oxidoreductase subunit A [Muribaculaceae bacterium]